MIDITAHDHVMITPYGDISRPSINQSAVIGIDDRLDHFVLKVGFSTGVPPDLQRTQEGRVKGATLAAFNHSCGQLQQPKHLGDVPKVSPITPFPYLNDTNPSGLSRKPQFHPK